MSNLVSTIRTSLEAYLERLRMCSRPVFSAGLDRVAIDAILHRKLTESLIKKLVELCPGTGRGSSRACLGKEQFHRTRSRRTKTRLSWWRATPLHSTMRPSLKPTTSVHQHCISPGHSSALNLGVVNGIMTCGFHRSILTRAVEKIAAIRCTYMVARNPPCLHCSGSLHEGSSVGLLTQQHVEMRDSAISRCYMGSMMITWIRPWKKTDSKNHPKAVDVLRSSAIDQHRHEEHIPKALALWVVEIA